MSVFVTLILKLLPIYIVIGLGFWLTRLHKLDKDTLVKILIYLIAPVVIFSGVYSLDLSGKLLLVPLIFFCISSCLATLSFVINKKFKPQSMRGILAFTAGSGNTGYFGLPVAIALFGDSIIGLAVLLTFGFVMYENTVGFFLAARGGYSARESINKLLHLPMLYAFLLALILNFMNISLGSVYESFVPNFRGAYVILGSFVVGAALAGFRRHHVDLPALKRAFIFKFILWPIMVGLLIVLDKNHWQIFNDINNLYNVSFLISLVPLAANTVAYATLLKTEPEKTAFMVFISTIFAIIYIPLMTTYVLPVIT